MTDDKEERIITRMQYNLLQERDWVEWEQLKPLPLAPKPQQHTDEEYDTLYSHWARCVNEGEEILNRQFDLEVRIKELEAFEPRCFGESYNFALSDCRKSVCPLAERCEKEFLELERLAKEARK
jgi:hypothetical protein